MGQSEQVFITRGQNGSRDPGQSYEVVVIGVWGLYFRSQLGILGRYASS